MRALLLFCELAVVLPYVHLACDDNSLRGAMCRAVVDFVRAHGPANLSATAMSPPIAEQIMAALDLIQGKDGSSRGAEKLQTLQHNAVYFREGLQKMGCIVLGTGASPIVVSPVCIFPPCAVLICACCSVKPTLLLKLLPAKLWPPCMPYSGHHNVLDPASCLEVPD